MADPWHFEQIKLLDGINMRIARAGAGDRLMVMLHGFPESWYSWRHQLRAFAPRFDCVAPELRGYGETDAPRGVANYRIEKLVEDVVGLIETLGYQNAILIGHEWGGAIARAPDRSADVADLGRARRRTRQGADLWDGGSLRRAVRDQVHCGFRPLGAAGASGPGESVSCGLPRLTNSLR